MQISVFILILLLIIAFVIGFIAAWLWIIMRYGGYTVSYKRFQDVNGREAIEYNFDISARAVVEHKWLLLRCKRNPNLYIGAAGHEKSYNEPVDLDSKEYKKKKARDAEIEAKATKIQEKLVNLYAKLDEDDHLSQYASLNSRSKIEKQIDELEDELEELLSEE